ncbi:uncharacterized protein EV422DRAFT_539199 [Fimicolochytrium jonesii]|uniref:uncharacterized protein n=1 Tax=Fimicolochytrium jonesii TaxID=1396493 RepID=UPI0022FEAEE4|nr:uncharacterized protein EV422DRAFT_539199 [Fimicolochytrium jonesii]KAI8818250.1 hypothetical protein EV422DRAFT_539199 [Fimicolochytrium jonesii]
MVSQTFEWKEGGHNVVLTGDFIDWSQDLVAEKGEDGVFRAKLERAPGTKIVFKFVVDGDWRNATNYPTEADESGNQNNFFVFPEDVIVDDVPAHVVSAGSIPDVISNSAGIVIQPQEEPVVVPEPTSVEAPGEHHAEVAKTEEPVVAAPEEVAHPHPVDEPSIATVDEVQGHVETVDSTPEKVVEREEPVQPTHIETEAVQDAAPVVAAHEPKVIDLATAEVLAPAPLPVAETVPEPKLEHVTTSVNTTTSAAPMLDTPEIEPFTVPFTTTSSDGAIVDEPGDVHVITKEVKTTIIEAETIEEAVKAFDQDVPATSTLAVENPVVESTRESSVASLPAVEPTLALPPVDAAPAAVLQAPVEEYKPVVEEPTPVVAPTPAAEIKTPELVPETPATESKPAAVEPAAVEPIEPAHTTTAAAAPVEPAVPAQEPETPAPAAPERTTSVVEEAKLETPKPSIETTHSNTSASKVTSPSAASPSKKPGFWKKVRSRTYPRSSRVYAWKAPNLTSPSLPPPSQFKTMFK